MKFCKGLIVSALIFFSFAFRCTAADGDIGEMFLSKKFPEDILNSISDTATEKLFSSVGSYEIADIIAETKYYPENIAENADLEVKTVSVKLKNKQNSIYMGETVCVYWEWLDNKPKIREEDYLFLKWSDNRLNYETDSFYAEDYSRKNTQDNQTVRNTYNTLAEAKQNSIGHWIDLYEKENCVGGVMILRLIPESFELTDSKNIIKCEYTHYITTLPTIIICVFVFLFVCILFIVIKKKLLISRKN